jgi:hypothetical protein
VNKQKAEGQEMCRMVRREMGRHSVDCSEVQVSVTHGMVHLHGRVRPMRGHEGVFEVSVNALLKALRQRPGVRDVVAEWTALF